MQKTKVRKLGSGLLLLETNTHTSAGPQLARAVWLTQSSSMASASLTGVQPWQSGPGQQVVPLSSNQDRRPLGGHTQTPTRDNVFFGYGFQQVGFCFGVSGLLREEQGRTGAGDE